MEWRKRFSIPGINWIDTVLIIAATLLVIAKKWENLDSLGYVLAVLLGLFAGRRHQR
jgi:hypothetical protein